MAGDRAERVAQLADRYGRMVFATAYRILGNADDAEDALQEALIELLRQDPVPADPAAWLFKTVRRRAMNLARGERR